MIESESEAREYVAQLCDTAAMERLEQFAKALIEENAQQNLISKPSEAQIWQRHIADSAQLLEHVAATGTGQAWKGDWLDLGTGAGFPGIVIAAMRPDCSVVLVESRKRRIEWLERMVRELDLPKTRVEGCRLEAIEPFPTAIISARAFAPLPKLLRLSAPLSTKSTRFILPKGRKARQELEELPAPSRTMFHVKHSVTDAEAGIIVSRDPADKAQS